MALALALLPLPLALLAPLALLLALIDPALGPALAILSVPIQELVHLPGGLSYTQAAMLLALGAWAGALLARRAPPLLAGRLFVPWALFLWALLFATAFSPFSATAAIKETLRWAEAGLIWLMTINLVRRPRQAALLVACLLLAPLAEAAIGLVQFLAGAGPPSFRIAADLPFVRAYGTIGQPNSFAGYLNMAWPLALALAVGLTAYALRRPARVGRMWLLAGLAWLAALALLAGLAASLSRGAWLGAAIGLIGMALALGGRMRWAALAAIGLAGAALVLGGVGLLPAFLAQRLVSIGAYLAPFDAGAVAVTPANFAVVERMSQVQAGWRMLLVHPLSGVGPGNYSVAYPQFAVGSWYVSRGHAHNFYVHMAGEAGLVGLGAYLVLLIGVLRQAVQTLRSVTHPIWRSIALGCCGIIAAVLGHDLFENLHVLSMGIQLAAAWGLLGSLEVIEKRPHM